MSGLAGESWRIRNESQRAGFVRELMNAKMPFGVQIVPSDRSLPQNNLSHRWYGIIGREDPEHNPITARRFSKLHFGVPILRADDEGFRDSWDRILKPLPYDLKLELMDRYPVTSLMDEKQMCAYLTQMQVHWAERGVVLTGLDRGYSEMPEAKRA